MTKTLTKGQNYNLHTLRFVGWTEGDGSGNEGHHWTQYFNAVGCYYGPDVHGIEPIFEIMPAIGQDINGKWWVHLDCDGHFDPNLISASSNGVWWYNGAPCESIMGPYDSKDDAESRLAAIVDTNTILRQKKLHELLELALEDFAKCEQQPDKFEINMSIWLRREGKICFVCLAGAMMAQRLLGGDPPRESTPAYFDYETGDRLRALDKLRRGRVAEAYELVNGGTAPDYLWDLEREVPDYHESRGAWWDAMHQLLEDLRKADI